MIIKIHRERVPAPVLTPFGVIDKSFRATARLKSTDNFTVEVQIAVKTGELNQSNQTGIYFQNVTIVADDKAPMGVTTSHLRSVQLKQLLEAIIHQAIYPGTSRKSSKVMNPTLEISPEQQRASQIVLENPGKPHALLISEEFGIEIQSARNLLTRMRKSGLIPNARTSVPAEPNYTFKQMSDEGAYIDAVIAGKIRPISPREFKAKKTAVNRQKRKGK